MKKTVLFLLLMLCIPMCYADDCGITNLATCLPEKMAEYGLTLINAPFQPFTDLAKNLLSEPVSTDMFKPIWAIITYIISIFYGIFMLIAGFNFIISAYSAEKREMAKEWLKNTVLMILFVQASYFLYAAICDISSAMTTGVINLIDPNFFLVAVDNLPNIALELILNIPYLLSLLLTIILLAIRYALVAIGVIFFPIGIFLSFIPPLKSYGKLVINILMVIIFLPFFQCLILLGCSMLLNVGLFADFKILVMISAYSLVCLVMIFLMIFAIAKAAFGAINSDVGKAVKVVAGAGG